MALSQPVIVATSTMAAFRAGETLNVVGTFSAVAIGTHSRETFVFKFEASGASRPIDWFSRVLERKENRLSFQG